jgi:HD superfamily phosphohydrolase
VLHQTQRIINSINRSAEAFSSRRHLPIDTPVPRFEETQLRLAALVHDIGHGFMSHVSERAVSNFLKIEGEDLLVLRREAAVFFNCIKSPALAEVLSGLLVLLPEFRHVLSAAQIPDWNDADALAFRMARLIVGGRDVRRPFLTEILSGSMDADKLDYLPRDCYMAGLPMPVDVDRLLEKISVVDIPSTIIPPEDRQQFDLRNDEFLRVLAINATGTRAFEELVVSRALLFQKLYHHQKVRAMEGMVKNAIELLIQVPGPFQKLSTFLKLADDEFLLGSWPASPAETSVPYMKAKELVRSVVTRQPFVRALAFGPTLVDTEDGWRSLATLVEDQERGQLRTEVAILARSYLSAAGQPGLAAELDESLILIDLPDVQGIVATAPVFVADDQLGVHKYGQGHEARRWTEAYEFQKTLGYVFCPDPFSVAVHFAFREIAFRSVGVSLLPESWSLAKQSGERLSEAAGLLTARGIEVQAFQTASRDQPIIHLRNLEKSKRELLEKYSNEIALLERRFRTYKSASNRVASRLEITEWLIQFQYYEIPLVIRTLSAISFWDRSALSDALRFGAEALFGSHRTVQVFGIGGATTSANHLSYLWDDVRNRIGVQIEVLNSIQQLQPTRPLLLYDDNVGSGGQGATVLMQWLGVARSQWPVDERHVDPLEAEAVARMKQADVAFCYLTGRRSGLEKVLQVSEEYLGRRPRGLVVVPTDLSCFDPAARVYETKEETEQATAIFSKAGKLALSDRRAEKSEAWIDERSLGYGNAGGLTVFFYNTPTTTLTALWKESSSDTRWRALFPRRPRLQ